MKTINLKALVRCSALLLTSLSTLIFVNAASAHSQHTPNICSTTAPDICAHMGYESLTASVPTIFMTHFMPKAGTPAAADPKLISNVNISIWMDMGTSSHAGPPVKVNQLDDVHFEVSDAVFTMAGPWIVKIAFEFDGKASEILIPITVQ